MTVYDDLDLDDGVTYVSRVEDRRSPAARRVEGFDTAGRPGGAYVGLPPAGRALTLSGAIYRTGTEQTLETAKDTLLATLARPRRRLTLGPDSRFIVCTPAALAIAPRTSISTLEWSVEFIAEDAYFSAASPTGDVRTIAYGSGDLAPGETTLYRSRAALTPGGSAPAPVRAILVNQAGSPTPVLWGLANRTARIDHRLPVPGGVALVTTASVAAPGALVVDGERGEVWSLDLTNVVGWWPFDDASGSVRDLSGDSRDLSAAGAVTYRADGPVFGAVESAGGGAFTSSSAALALTGDITATGWIYTTSAGSLRVAFGKSASNGGFAVWRTAGNVMAAAVGSGAATRTATGTTTIEVNRWYHVALVWNDTTNTISLYLDGVLEAQTAGGAFTVGGYSGDFAVLGVNDLSGNTGYWIGRVAGVAVLDTTLTAAQIRAISQRGGLWAGLGSQVDWYGQLPRLDPQAGATNLWEWRVDAASAPTIRASLAWRSRYE